MNYIINPMWFYWIEVADKIDASLGFLGFAAFATCLGALIAWLGICETKEGQTKAKKITFISIITGIALMIVTALIPSQGTLVAMIAAKFATYENLELSIDMIKAALDYIIAAIHSLN